VVRTPGSSLTEAELVRHCRDQLAAFKVPRRVVFADADGLPKTTTGKIQKFVLVREATR
jgi:fatty-acyl-CoA synthase